MLQEIVLKQKQEYERRLTETYISREVVMKGMDTDLMSVVIGPRRAGKSFFCMHALREVNNKAYVNFDDETLFGVTRFDEIMSAVGVVYDQPKTLLFDEIQNVPQWELIVNRLQREGYRLILTGSNSKLLSRELSSHLTGRHVQTCLLPFSFREVISLSESSLTNAEKQIAFAKYIINGGFPEPWVKNLDSRSYLASLFDSVLFKDIVKRYNIRFPVLLDNLSKFLISNISAEFTLKSLTRAVNAKSDHTIEKYYGYLEEAFLFFKVPRFSYKVREQMKTANKLYCYDSGFYQAKAFRFSANRGNLLENAVAIELRRRELEGMLNLFYWKNDQKEEVDFVVQQGMSIEQLIQVSADVSNPAVNNREIRSLLKAGAELRCNRLIILTDNVEKSETHGWFGLKGEIEYMPLWKWLLAGISLT